MDAPARVRARFEELKRERDHIYLRNIRGMYYVYRVLSRSENGRVRTTSEYIGRITPEGAFVSRGMGSEEKRLELARAVIEEHGGKVVMPEPRSMEEEEAGREERKTLTPSEEDERILTILSMNGRARMKGIGKTLGMTAQAATRRVHALERRYGIRYIAEIDPIKLGYVEYMVFLKFRGERPGIEEIKRAFEDRPMVQLCALLKGDYDLMLYVLVDSTNIDRTMIDLVYNTFTNYTLTWHIKSGATRYGMIPIRDRFFDLLKERVWHRGEGNPRMPGNAILHREYEVLRALNSDGGKSFKDIDSDAGMVSGSARYSYLKLLDEKVLKRITIREEALPVSYTGIMQYQTNNVSEYNATRNEYRLDLVRPTERPYNTYSLVFDLYDPEGFLTVIPFLKDESIDAKADSLKASVKGVELRTIVITGVLIGSLCFRRYDNTQSAQYANLVKARRIEEQRSIDYAKL